MSKSRMDPPLGAGAPPRLFVKAQRVARPPTPWAWAIYDDTRPDPIRRSTRLYPSAAEAWAVGHAMLSRLPRSAVRASVDQSSTASVHSLASA